MSRKFSLSNGHGSLDESSGKLLSKTATDVGEDLESILNNIHVSNRSIQKSVKRTKSFTGTV